MMNQAAEGHTDADSLLASATDLLNTWAREMSVEQAHAPEDIKGVIDRLWSELSTRLHPAARAEGEPPQALTGESLRKLAYEKCGLQPAWMDNRWQRLADSIVEFIGAGEREPQHERWCAKYPRRMDTFRTQEEIDAISKLKCDCGAAAPAPVKDARPRQCTDCKMEIGTQHRPSCHRQGLVTLASIYGPSAPKDAPTLRCPTCDNNSRCGDKWHDEDAPTLREPAEIAAFAIEDVDRVTWTKAMPIDDAIDLMSAALQAPSPESTPREVRALGECTCKGNIAGHKVWQAEDDCPVHGERERQPREGQK